MLCKVYTGAESDPLVNVNTAVELGMQQQHKFMKNSPSIFLSNYIFKVVRMKEKKKGELSTGKAYNPEFLFSRVIYLLSVGRLEIAKLFDYKFAPFPTFLCRDFDEPSYPHAKSFLQTKLRIKVSRHNMKEDVTFIDGGGMLHATINWRKTGKVSDLIIGIKANVGNLLNTSDVFFYFQSLL